MCGVTLNHSEFGGATRDRTADLLHAMQALSQLSYNPKFRYRMNGSGGHSSSIMVELRGIEPRTSLHAMQALSQLSYNPTKVGLGDTHPHCPGYFMSIGNLVELRGIEPRTSCMPCKRSPS